MSLASLLIIVLVALLVIHPKRLPEMSFALGRILRKIKHWYHETLSKTNSLL